MAREKKSGATDATPKTDVEALQSIVAWSANRPEWQRYALRLLAQSDTLSDGQIDELYALVRKGGSAPNVLEESDLRSPREQSAAISLKSISNPLDVNALAPDQTLSFEKVGLTIIYGDNGAGKSGYARILKHACRARIDGKAPSIIPNVYTEAPGIPRARIAFVVNGQNRQADWELGRAAPTDLSAVSVFDARTAHVHVDGANDVAYVPSSLDLLQRLAQIADQLRDRLRKEKTAIQAQTPQFLSSPPIGSETEVALKLKTLAPETEFEELRSLSVLAPEELTRLEEIRRDMGADPVKTARRLLDTTAGLERFSLLIERLCNLSGTEALSHLRELHEKKGATQAAAEASARDRFAAEPLANVGSEIWRELWEAARRYALEEARTGHPFPPATADDHCPLCQQELSSAALDRFARFEAFIRDDTKQQADAAAKAYAEHLENLDDAWPSMAKLFKQLQFISELDGGVAASETIRPIVIKAAWQLRRIRRYFECDDFSVVDADPSPAIEKIKQLNGVLEARRAALSADADSPERKALIARLAEFEARAWLATVLDDVEAEIARKTDLAAIDRGLGETNTRSITEKSGALAEALVTDTLRAQFAREVSALGVGDLAVELKKEQSQAGAARFRVRLVRKPSTAVGAVLSEGEHRCVALAAFMAELSTSGTKSAIIFDDPVSSLDHRHRSEVAARLAEEAKHRQVIVLTHDVAFLMLLNQAAANAAIHVGYRCLARGPEQAGYCSHDLPYNARPVEDVLNAIETDVRNKTALWERGRQAEWRNTVRSTLEQLRETWERAVEEIIGPVLKRLSNKVDSANLRQLTVLEIADCDAMRAGFRDCSEMLHSAGESLNPKLPTPDDLQKEIEKLRQWFTDLRSRQEKTKAA